MTNQDVANIIYAVIKERESSKQLEYFSNTKFAVQHPFKAVFLHLTISKDYRLRFSDIFELLNRSLYDKINKGDYIEYLNEMIQRYREQAQHCNVIIDKFLEGE